MKSKKDVYTSAELVYAAFDRCHCGAGIAYPRDVQPFGETAYWDCSAILTGTAIPDGQEGSVKHTDKLPFAFYEIKSEGQPSARGTTTRPAADDTDEGKLAQAIAKARADIQYADGLDESFARQQESLDKSKARWAGIKADALELLAKHGQTP